MFNKKQKSQYSVAEKRLTETASLFFAVLASILFIVALSLFYVASNETGEGSLGPGLTSLFTGFCAIISAILALLFHRLKRIAQTPPSKVNKVKRAVLFTLQLILLLLLVKVITGRP